MIGCLAIGVCFYRPPAARLIVCIIRQRVSPGQHSLQELLGLGSNVQACSKFRFGCTSTAHEDILNQAASGGSVPLHREKSGFPPAKKSINFTRANHAKVPILTRPGSYVGKTQAFWTCSYAFGDRQLAHPGLEIPSRHPEATNDVVQQSCASGR
jgi:hypothetical protein